MNQFKKLSPAKKIIISFYSLLKEQNSAINSLKQQFPSIKEELTNANSYEATAKIIQNYCKQDSNLAQVMAESMTRIDPEDYLDKESDRLLDYLERIDNTFIIEEIDEYSQNLQKSSEKAKNNSKQNEQN